MTTKKLNPPTLSPHATRRGGRGPGECASYFIACFLGIVVNGEGLGPNSVSLSIGGNVGAAPKYFVITDLKVEERSMPH